MAEGYQEFQNESEDRAPASWKRFYVVLTGRTNKVHQSVVKTFKSSGQTEVTSPGEADYCLVFCPVTTRVGCDVSEAMDHLHPGKAAVLVVMHQTFNPDQVIPPSSRLVEDQRVKLTLDFLFHQNKLLSCKLNNKMNNDIKTFFGVSLSENLRLPVVVFFQGLLSCLLSMLDLLAVGLQFVFDKTGLTRLLPIHLGPTFFRCIIVIIFFFILTIVVVIINGSGIIIIIFFFFILTIVVVIITYRRSENDNMRIRGQLS